MKKTPKTDPPRVLYVGLKVNETERATLEREAKARDLSMSEVVRLGVATLAEEREKAAQQTGVRQAALEAGGSSRAVAVPAEAAA